MFQSAWLFYWDDSFFFGFIFFFLASFEKPPYCMDLAMESLFLTPSLVCTATAIRLTRVLFFAFVPGIEILSIRLTTRPGISTYSYPGDNVYLFRTNYLNSYIVPGTFLHLQARAER